MTTATIAEAQEKGSSPKTQAQISSEDQPGQVKTKNLLAVGVENLLSDHRWQRPVSRRAEEMAESWDYALAQTIVVSKRSNSDMVVIDGQHRAAAARIAGVKELIAEVHEGLTAREEAELYDKLNTTRQAISALDRFKARVFYRDPTAMAIKDSVEKRGGVIRESVWRGQSDEIAAVYSLERVFRAGGEELLGWILDVLKESFGELNAETVSLLNVSGLLMFWSRHGENIDKQHLVNQVRDLGALGLRQQANAHRQLWGGTASMNGYRALVELYNRTLAQKQRLRP